MNHPAPTRAAHQRFCIVDGWEDVRSAEEGRGGHLICEKQLPDGQVLRTRIGLPPDQSTYAANMWSHILRDQLDVDAQTFWNVVDRGEPAPRTARPAPPAHTQIRVDLAWRLVNEAGVTEEELASMTAAEASQRMAQHYLEQAQD